MNWDLAAAAAVNYILSESRRLGGEVSLPIIRSYFDDMISEFWLKDLEATKAWASLGALGVLAAGGDILPGDHAEISEKITSVLVRKQTDYGHENIRRFGNNGLLVRVHDKIARLENLAARAQSGSPQNESISDNFVDLIGYSAIGMMWNEGTFLLPLASTVAESNNA